MTTAISKLTNLPRALAFAGAFAAMTFTATASYAAPQAGDAPEVTVRYSDLNLSTTDGASELYRRISVAARQVCPDVYSRDLRTSVAGERCEANAVAKAVRELNSPQLALIYAAHVSHG
jgi:UrcA family protein